MKIFALSAAALLASAVAFPSVSHAAGCALYDPNCATYTLPKNPDESNAASRTRHMERHAMVRERHQTNDAAASMSAAGAGGGYDSWDHRSYAERNGFACSPGNYFMGFDRQRHMCQ